MPVLLIIDMLNSFLAAWEPARRRELIAATNLLARHFRSRNWPVIWVRQAFKSDLSDAFLEMRDIYISINIEGTYEAKIADDLDWKPVDIVIVKKRYSPFFGTNLDDILHELSASELFLSGINTHACVRMAAIAAYQRDYRVTLVDETVDSYDLEHAAITLRYLDGKIRRIVSLAKILANGR